MIRKYHLTIQGRLSSGVEVGLCDKHMESHVPAGPPFKLTKIGDTCDLPCQFCRFEQWMEAGGTIEQVEAAAHLAMDAMEVGVAIVEADGETKH